MAVRRHDANGQADANDLLSWYYALKTDFGVAGIYAYRALKIHEQLGDSARMAKTLSNIYVYYRNMGRRQDANNYFYQAFKMASLSKAEMASFLKHISATSGKVLEVFDNILKWLRLQLSGYRYEPVHCLLLPLMQRALGPLEAELEQKQIIVKNYISGSVAVLADEEMLKLVNIQLLQIAAAVALAGSMLEITVDQTMGQTEVFIRVKTGEDARFVLAGLENWQDNGLAPGLVISRDLMKMMKGHITSEGQEHSYLAFGYILP